MRPLAIALSIATGVSGAYVETRDCAGGFTFQGVQVALSSSHRQEDLQRLNISVADIVGWEKGGCHKDHQEEARARFRIESLGGIDEFEISSSNYTCPERGWGKFDFDHDIAPPYPLDAMFVTVDLYDVNDETLGCVTADLIPEISPHITRMARWLPIAVLILVSSVAAWREAATSSNDQPEQLGTSIRETSRSHVTRMTDCVGYIQFIFLSSALSLYYPGFLQPVTSATSWSTLMFPTGLAQGSRWYTGTQDGVYVMNGTMSGTAGLELMAQIAGGTQTFDTWLNIISLAALVFVLLVGVAFAGTRLPSAHAWMKPTGSPVARKNSPATDTVKHALWSATRLFCACLLLPLVTWTMYQLSNASLNPVQRSVGATLSICVLFVLFCWAMHYQSPRSMGYLLIDNFEEHREISNLKKTQNLYSTSVYMILIARGIVHGGLQRMGSVQLLILLGVEIVQIVLYALVFRIVPMSTRSGSMPLLRLLILALQCGILPGVAGHKSKMIIGLVTIFTHGLVLVGLFLVPALIDLGRLARSTIVGGVSPQRSSPQPAVYSLRQLNARPSKPNPSLPPETFPSVSGDYSAHTHTSLSGTDEIQQTPSPVPSGKAFFRPPRSSSVELLSRASRPSLQCSSLAEGSNSGIYQHMPSSSSSSSGATTPASSNDYRHLSGFENDNASDEKEQISLNAASMINCTTDYSVREVDQYYIAPRRLSFNQQGESEGRQRSFAKLTGFWTRHKQ